jgi:hypothetical protein
VRLLDPRPPYPAIETYLLAAVPRAGELINVAIRGTLYLYKVEWVFINPFDKVSQVNVAISRTDQPTWPLSNSQPTNTNQQDARQNNPFDQFIKAQLQLFEKGESYSKVIILLGYAGIFAVWNYVKDVLTVKGMMLSAISVGISLLVYVSWEIMLMYGRATAHNNFNRLIFKTPEEFAKAYEEFSENNRKQMVADVRFWRVMLLITIGFGYAGTLLLLYNAAAKLTGLPQLP